MAPIVLMLDFDGTLCPIANTPAKAYLLISTRKLLEKISQKIPIAIISGRGLKDLKKKVGVQGLIYSGNHGLEWEINGKYNCMNPSKKSLQDLLLVYNFFKKILPHYSGLFIENKKISFSVHYRQMLHKDSKKFKKEKNRIINLMSKKEIMIIEGKKVIEFKPKINWNKGSFAKLLINFLEKKYSKYFLPIFIGDDKTDEDVFKAIKNGITIKVGSGKTSAKYYLRRQDQINDFLKLIVFLLQ